jgi:hypothetical protein
MRILRLTARRLPDHPEAPAAEDVAEQFAAALRAQHERGVAHVVVSHLSADVLELAVFLREGTSDDPQVGGAEGWVVDQTQPGPEPW